jgi:hypothetical protein
VYFYTHALIPFVGYLAAELGKNKGQAVAGMSREMKSRKKVVN